MRPSSIPARIRTVDVELIWTRFEKDGPARLLAERDADDSTLSVCMVISWPEAGLVDRTAEFPGGAEILHTLIDLFERLREQEAVVAARSRIEDGRFVGWLSYPDVLTAQDAVLPSATRSAPAAWPSSSRPATNASPSTGTPRPMRRSCRRPRERLSGQGLGRRSRAPSHASGDLPTGARPGHAGRG